MPIKKVFIPEIGDVLLAKRRGAKNLRLSITAKGQVRVSMPAWTPYAAGVSFAKSRADWINSHLKNYREVELIEGMLVGKAHRLHFVNTAGSTITTRITASIVQIATGLPFNNKTVQTRAEAACERALRNEAEHLLPQRIKVLAQHNGFTYKTVKIRKLTSRWGSCSQDKTISLSYYLMQLPWRLIDYVLLHELAHTENLNHGPNFWRTFERALPEARALRKDIRAHKPRLEPT